MEVPNIDETKSRREFSRYFLTLPVISGSDLASDTLIIETAVMTPASPAVRLCVNSLIGEYCMANRYADIIEDFGLGKYQLSVNSLERTYVDKVYVLCDYYLKGNIPSRQSRHIYDLYKLGKLIVFNNGLADLFKCVREQRCGLHGCLSAEPDVFLSKVVMALDESRVYEPDYKSVTQLLLYEDVSYGVARGALSEVASFLDSMGM